MINPYLKKFADEIYAVGRNEYRNHMDTELRKEAEDIINGFKATADLGGVSYNVIVRYGPPEEEITKKFPKMRMICLSSALSRALRSKQRYGLSTFPEKYSMT